MGVRSGFPSSSFLQVILIYPITTRLAEVASIILCICFPMMPRFVKLISDHRISHKSPSASTSETTPKRKPAKGLKAGISHDVWNTGSHTEDLARLKSPYERLEEATNELSGQETRVGGMGIRRTVDIELASWDGHDAEKGRTSIV